MLTEVRVERVTVPAPLLRCIDVKPEQVPPTTAPHVETAEFLPILTEAYLDCRGKLAAIRKLQEQK